MENRRLFLQKAGAVIASYGSLPLFRCTFPPAKPLFQISLAEWSLHRSLFAGEIDHLDFASIAKKNFQIDAVEYVNQFFMDKAEDKSYLTDMKKRCDDLGVKSLLIMCDNEGRIGDPDALLRKQAVENHFKWLRAAQFLGCHSIRVNAFSQGTYEEQQKLVADGLLQLCTYADDVQVNVLVENHGGLSSDGKWLVGVLKMVNHSRVGSLPDFGNFQLSQDEWYDRYLGVAELMPFAKGVSAKTGEFDAQGNDIRIDYRRMLRIVVDAGYRGYVGIESSGSQLSEMEAIQKTKELLERTRDEMTRDLAS
ncbi:TIM barrel protein [candidate division KSB1 bacterium]|nr:TIM barrel protein [candidate division KSB1 bacterium]